MDRHHEYIPMKVKAPDYANTLTLNAKRGHGASL